jgi:hypothetical protein
MHTTDMTMIINMGLEDEILTADEACRHFKELETHIGDIIPTLDDLDNLEDAAHIKSVSLKNVIIHAYETAEYKIQFTVTIQHDVPFSLLLPNTIQEITEIIFEHGANSPITFDEIPNHFLYPYQMSRVIDDDDEIMGSN